MASKVLVISDTHCEDFRMLPSNVIEEMDRVDAIIHVGDYTTMALVDELKTRGSFYGVRGNMDDLKVKMSLPESLILSLEGFKIGIIHPTEGGPPYNIKRRIKGRFKEKVDAIVFVHTHKPEISSAYGILFMNPGTLKGSFLHPKTYIVLYISKRLEPHIITI